MKSISQRELRNDSGQVMREVQRGASFRVTGRGVPVAGLTPLVDDPLAELTLREGTGVMEFPLGCIGRRPPARCWPSFAANDDPP